MIMSKKEIAADFLQRASSGKVREAFAAHVHPHFRHHLGFFRGNRLSYLEAVEENAREYPDKTYEVLRALEDGDLVAIHGKVTFTPEQQWSVIHIFRFEGEQIVESWEASQEDLKDFPNENGIF
jgi:predicted SnoaL-like aldol condensation-catalyzing enzyme